MFYLDSSYFLYVFIPGLILGLWAQIKLQSAYSKYSRVGVESGSQAHTAAVDEGADGGSRPSLGFSRCAVSGGVTAPASQPLH